MKNNRQKTILIIEDEATVRQSYKNYLEDVDYKTLLAENGRIGLELFDKEKVDLVLVDLRMPEVDGIEVLEQITKKSPDTPIIVISGAGKISDAVEALRLGAWNYLLKPIEDLSVFMHAITNALEKARLIKENRMYHEHLEDVVKERTKALNNTNKALTLEITERKRIETNLINALKKAEESDRLKTAFLQNLSHEIRTPMNGILGFNNLLKEPGLTGDQQQEFISIIESSGERMLNTISNLMDISMIESGQVKVAISDTNLLDLTENLTSSFTPEVEKKGLKLIVNNTLLSSEAIIKTDLEKVYAIQSNLINNAIKYTHEGYVEFGYSKVQNEIIFSVKDTGKGINKKQMGSIFERFRQGSESYNREYEGTGLGLSIAKAYVEMIGGKIWVESEIGTGSTFFFTIPNRSKTDEKPIIKNIVSENEEKIHIKDGKILIVEDHEASEVLMTMTLEVFGYEVITAKNGVEAVEACRNNPDILLIMMDIRMPEMNGYEATRKIREFNKRVIIIAQTAHALAGDRASAIDAGCNDYISKPFERSQLVDLIGKHLNINHKSVKTGKHLA